MKNDQNKKPDKVSGDYSSEADDDLTELSIKQEINDDLNTGEDWETLISKHKLRYDIWLFLNLYPELNVTQISKWVKQSKSTVSRILRDMENDDLLKSRRGEIRKGERERIPPKFYRISDKFREADSERDFMEIPSNPDELEDFLLSEIRNHRKAIYNITRLVNYLSSSLNFLDNQLKQKEITNATNIYKSFLSGINEPEFNFMFLDKKRFKQFYDLRLEYVLKLKKLILEQELDPESAFVYVDSFLPLRALLDLNIIRDSIDEESIGLLIFSGDWMLKKIFSYPFNKEFEADIFENFLTAFNTYGEEVFSKELNRIKFGDYTALIEPVSDFMICYIFKGHIIIARQKLSQFTEQIRTDASILQSLEEFHKRNQVAELKEIPSLEILLTKIFITNPLERKE